MKKFGLLAAVLCSACGADLAQEPDNSVLVEALRGGGYVIVMRHASAPFVRPDAASAAPGNINLERQFDDEGEETASAMGEALTRLAVPVGGVLSSPLFRAVQTAQALGFTEVEFITDLAEVADGIGLDDAQQDTQDARSAWLSAKATEPPPAGTNLLIISHLPNLRGAFGDEGRLLQGESLVVKPQDGNAVIVARVRIEDWPTFVLNSV